ncbi:hypothetical protein LVD15_16450 [Fulvivirga maritima]|uniref:DUF6630 family protein n=1 Tax=Fulvivirga maritima TaxID=2904247 RepID=UPI001F25AB7D|nr:hypothetical protein [Fulvivirga maritima]UII24890.1 hypothetical protein LVD15_16450 [Fulvivirga maritima]
MNIFRIFRNRKMNPKELCLQLGKRLYHTHSVEFQDYYEEYLEDLGEFKDMYFDVYEEFDFKRLGPFEVLYAYGAHYEHAYYIDWRGEENEKEVESYVEQTFPKVKFSWSATETLRSEYSASNLRDGNFIIKLFKAVDEDIRRQGYALLFFTIDADGYCFIPTDIDTYELAIGGLKRKFNGAADIKG